MVKHIILWQLKDELSDTEKAAVKAEIKAGLEGLAGQNPGAYLHRSADRGAAQLYCRPDAGLCF